MSDERRKMNKHCTGTVPKAKHRNNTSYFLNQRDSSRSLTNNLVSDDYTNLVRSPRRNNHITMEAALDESPTYNGSINSNSNGRITPNSSQTSRRNSSTLKCDNVTKYPDKKQIEHKLSQIREYLRITSSLMTTMKNTDDQSNDQAEIVHLSKMMKDLTDSEDKLLNILESMEQEEENEGVQITEVNGSDISEPSTSSSRKNEHIINTDHNQDIEALKEQQIALMKMQQKAENKLKDARQIQEKLLLTQYANEKKLPNLKDKNMTEEDFDDAIRELEERAKRLNHPRPSNSNFQDKFLAEVDSLQNQIFVLHNANEERSQLIEVLDNRDAELRSQHHELQSKLAELQNKKQQVDQLVSQLQNLDNVEEDGDDIGGEVRRIVTMKDQLKKLKDMLEIVKTTENVVQNSNGSEEANELACDICTKAENFLLNDFQNVKPRPPIQTETNVLRYDNNTSTSVNENRQKQVNKNTREQQNKGVKKRTTSINELEQKKRELEDLMGKHKAGTSNLNHDIGADSKSEFSCTNSVNEAIWLPASQLPSHSVSSNHFSSDECQEDVNEYSELSDHQNPPTMPAFNHLPHTAKHRQQQKPLRQEYPHSDYDELRRYSCSPDRNVRSSSVATSGYIRERPMSNNEQDKLQVKKQLQLIKSVCETMLEQQQAPNNQQPTPPANVQLRNNLTPSPLYSEPRRFASPHPSAANTLANPLTEVPWLGAPPPADAAHYQAGWLATNTLQTQSFMLNTLNQCCQMLWIQQRELQNLRNIVTSLQDRVENGNGVPETNNQHHPHPQQIHTTPPCANNLYRPPQPQQQHAPKANHVAAACSMPNLNHHYNAAAMSPPSNLDLSYINHSNNAQNGRLLDPCLNNINQHHAPNNQPLQGQQLWNGQALNNQVAPGNRANNYWDNFRSYSRQNLLSTKNNDGFQNMPSLERANCSNERITNPFSLMTASKSNSEHESTSTSQENTPQRRAPFRHVDNNVSIPPPDVLNINNHNLSKFNERLDFGTPDTQQDNIDDLQMGFQMLLNTYNDGSSNHSNVSEERVADTNRKRNEWSKDSHGNEQIPKTKLFDELRENVYKEVASLISANEARPHFLIQLFRDLQLIVSDSLRLKILQSIQTVITHSFMTSQSRVSVASQQDNAEGQPRRSENGFSLQSTVWAKTSKNFPRNMENPDVESLPFKGVMHFLNENNENVIDQEFLSTFKQKLMESDSIQDVLHDTVFQKHFSNVLNEVLDQYQGKKLKDIKMHLLQSVGDLLRGELSFIQLIQETSPENTNVVPEDNHFKAPPPPPQQLFELQNNSPQLHNGDLAEADQSRGEEDDAEEEGAVGGFFELPQENADFHMVQSEDEVPTIDFANSGEGLDQVPTRLPTNMKSRSTTPNKDSSRPDSDNF